MEKIIGGDEMNYFSDRKEMIHWLCAGMGGVEVGTQAGNFAQEMLDAGVDSLHLVDAWGSLGGKYALDPANASVEIHALNEVYVRDRFTKYGPKVVVHKGHSIDIARTFERHVGFVYLDAAHDYDSVITDLFAWSQWVAKSGYLMGHDFVANPSSRAMGFGVIEAVRDFTAMTDWKLLALTNEDWPSFALAKK